MNNLLTGPAINLSIPEIAINLLTAAALGLASAYIYKRTHRGVSYSQSFVSSLVLVTVITALVIMVIGNSLSRAFGLIGAFTVVRFRTAVKDTRDMTFLFMCLALGLAAGTGSYQMAVIGLVVIGLLIVVLDRAGFGRLAAYEYILRFAIGAAKNGNEPYRRVFEDYLKESLLLNVRSLKEGRELELAFNIRLKDKKKQDLFVSELSRIKGVSGVEMLNTAGDVEY